MERERGRETLWHRISSPTADSGDICASSRGTEKCRCSNSALEWASGKRSTMSGSPETTLVSSLAVGVRHGISPQLFTA